MNAPSRSTIPVPLLLVLALLASVAPFGIDLYLPAFPRMAAELATSDTAIQLTLTMFLLGLAAGQLVFGPLSDRWGRRGPLLAGSAVFVAASVLAAVAPTIGVLLGARLVQGLTAAAGMVIGRAVIADLATGRAAARAFSLMMIVSGVAPVVAPLLGSLMVDGIGWRGVLLVLAGLAVAMLAGSAVGVRETHPRERRGTAQAGGFRALGRRAYLAATATFVFSFAVLMAYISASPFLYQVVIGMGPVSYGVLFALNALGLIASSAAASRLLRHSHPRRVLTIGTSWLLGAAVVLLVLALLPISAAWLMVPIFFAVASLGFVLGPATALALDAVPGAAGTGSAVLGAAQFGLGAAVSPLVSVGSAHSALPMAILIAVLAAIAVCASRLLASRDVPEPVEALAV
ncbi:Bcr/CflA family drug resistance efflux transporter [Lentzea pudingi]|uniref:Bcr/CflA family drug resistance efflux transporter n=1 Tax=Lentzea pudingi TaxID=1789439 RepID=A0ABQ2HST1_9PSEU|nr:multidrug effflux MFS transporter [Lentzea pudingi]GGM87180.1 Bcr/CflA family drug resistance efflux transporter [Lentzea pudingi]